MQGTSTEQLLDSAGKLIDARRFGEAESSVGIALMMDPRNLRALCFRAIIASELDKPDVAISTIEKAIKLAPQAPAVMNNAACVFSRCGRPLRAIELWKRLVQLVPNAAEAHYNIAITNMRVGDADAAESGFRKVLEIAPEHPYVRMNLADILKNSGLIEEAMDLVREGVRRHPGDLRQRSAMLYGMHFDPRVASRDIYRECAAWGKEFEALFTPFADHANDRSPERPLRIGYLSPNFRDHSETYFVLPLFRGMDRSRYETWAYCCNDADDAVTGRIRERTDQWRPVSGMTEQQIAHVIRNDRIDVLVDLTMHMEGSRLGVFALRAAPVQLTWLAYPSTTGMTRMDACMFDPLLVPELPPYHQSPSEVGPGAPPLCTERPFNLPDCYWCYEVYGPKPDVSAPPASKNGFVTFGSLNHYGKVTRETLGVWGDILQRVPNSRLILHVGTRRAGEAALAFLAQRGIGRARVACQTRVPRDTYMNTYRDMDIALDPFPYNGATTTCDALWMGVPVISRAGETAVSRAGRSILPHVGLQDLVADSWDQYVSIAQTLAADRSRLQELRATLRSKLEQSKVMDAGAFASAMSSVYRQLWRAWCARPPVQS